MQTLILDVGFQPTAVVPWTRAITLLFEGKVEVIHEHDAVVRSVTIELKVPSVVRFLRSIRGKKRSVKFSREGIFMRDHGQCQYCATKVSRSAFQYEHVIPRSQGGTTTWTNIVVACDACNQKKGGRTPAQAGMALRTQPVKPKSLPNVMRFTLTWATGMPPTWADFLASAHYWGDELEA
jgi:5-methylcytosine-specific restriction endonuclease McrA